MRLTMVPRITRNTRIPRFPVSDRTVDNAAGKYVVDGILNIKSGVQQGAGQDSDKQGTVHFFCEQCQSDGDNGGTSPQKVACTLSAVVVQAARIITITITAAAMAVE